ncbi:hypothetical protein H6P81_003464 [Aristolochia fimbriata]|uniref:Uncharacterized protein n=1 Tax=Aristolochia fimbriata TaxID=158543 RepID=A0AAV7FGF9_ARIFI|nr:hypothetical protein H6P81_003464 [Aristolochia fimbriata]
MCFASSLDRRWIERAALRTLSFRPTSLVLERSSTTVLFIFFSWRFADRYCRPTISSSPCTFNSREHGHLGCLNFQKDAAVVLFLY